MEKSGKKYKIKSFYDILDDGTAECGFNVYDVRTGDFITLIDDIIILSKLIFFISSNSKFKIGSK